MSLDFSLEYEIEEGVKKEVFDINITHNLTKMWSKANCYNSLYNTDGNKAISIISNIKSALINMNNYKDEYIKLEPDNKWGTYESAIKFLEEVYENCLLYPSAIIRISK